MIVFIIATFILFLYSLPWQYPSWFPRTFVKQPKATFLASLDLTPINSSTKEHAGDMSLQISGVGGISVDNELHVSATFRPSSGMLLILNQWSNPSVGNTAGLIMQFCPDNAYTFSSESDAFPQSACVSMQRTGNEWSGNSDVVFFRSGVYGGRFSITAFVKNFPNSTLVPSTSTPPFFQIDSEEVSVNAYNIQVVIALTWLVATLTLIQLYYQVYQRQNRH